MVQKSGSPVEVGNFIPLFTGVLLHLRWSTLDLLTINSMFKWRTSNFQTFPKPRHWIPQVTSLDNYVPPHLGLDASLGRLGKQNRRVLVPLEDVDLVSVSCLFLLQCIYDLMFSFKDQRHKDHAFKRLHYQSCYNSNAGWIDSPSCFQSHNTVIMFHAHPETSCPRATLNIHDCPTNYPATKDAYCATCPSWESPVKFAHSTNIKKSFNCCGVRFGIAIVQWLETTPKSSRLIIRCSVHTSYSRMTNFFTRKVHLEVEMTPNLRDREMHHPNASKALHYVESAFGNLCIPPSF